MFIPLTTTFFIIFTTYFLLKQRVKKRIDQKTTVLLTGGCMGIGKQLCMLLSLKKCKIIVLDKRLDLADSLKKDIQQNGGELIFYECDLSDQNAIQETINHIHEPINILINNAGVAKLQFHNQQTFDDVKMINAVNYLAPVQIIKLLLPRMEEQKYGHIVNIGSIMSILTGLKVTSYCASKHALLGFHNSLRVELKLTKSPIKTTFIAPWAVDTEMFKGFKSTIDTFIPILSEEKVAREIINAIEQEEEVHSIKSYYWLFANLMRFVPHPILDWVVRISQGPYVNEMVGRIN